MYCNSDITTDITAYLEVERRRNVFETHFHTTHQFQTTCKSIRFSLEMSSQSQPSQARDWDEFFGGPPIPQSNNHLFVTLVLGSLLNNYPQLGKYGYIQGSKVYFQDEGSSNSCKTLLTHCQRSSILSESD